MRDYPRADELSDSHGDLEDNYESLRAEIERLTMERDNARSLLEAATREGVIGQALADVERLKDMEQAYLGEVKLRLELEVEVERLRGQRFGPLVPPTAGAIAVFETVVMNSPTADMRAIPNQWLLNERALTSKVTEELETEIERLKALLETGREIVEQYAPGFELWLEEVDAALAGKEDA